MNDDAELLRRYIEERSQVAFTELVQRRIGIVYAAAFRRVGGDAQLAEDVAQRVFTALARKASTVRSHSTVVGWLLVSTALAAAETVRAEQRRKKREALAVNEAESSTSATPEGTELQPWVEEAMLQLRTEDRDALVLRFFEQLSFGDVGRALRTTEEGARKRVDRALEKVRLHLAHRGITSSATVIGVALVGLTAVPSPNGIAASVATQALAQGATSATTAALGHATTMLPWAAAVVGTGWLAVSLHTGNQSLQAQLAAAHADEMAITHLESETRRLEARRRETSDVRRAATPENPPAVASRNESVVAGPRPALAHVQVTAANTIEWDRTAITLGEFVRRLSQLGTDPAAANGRLTVRAVGTSFPALSYVIEEAAKAKVPHLAIESDAKPEANQGTDTWF